MNFPQLSPFLVVWMTRRERTGESISVTECEKGNSNGPSTSNNRHSHLVNKPSSPQIRLLSASLLIQPLANSGIHTQSYTDPTSHCSHQNATLTVPRSFDRLSYFLSLHFTSHLKKARQYYENENAFSRSIHDLRLRAHGLRYGALASDLPRHSRRRTRTASGVQAGC